tara:strand:- start:571 stop:687 length:117 start_codon:yes stop_codon:yes gene_type:complete
LTDARESEEENIYWSPLSLGSESGRIQGGSHHKKEQKE